MQIRKNIFASLVALFALPASAIAVDDSVAGFSLFCTGAQREQLELGNQPPAGKEIAGLLKDHTLTFGGQNSYVYFFPDGRLFVYRAYYQGMQSWHVKEGPRGSALLCMQLSNLGEEMCASVTFPRSFKTDQQASTDLSLFAEGQCPNNPQQNLVANRILLFPGHYEDMQAQMQKADEADKAKSKREQQKKQREALGLTEQAESDLRLAGLYRFTIEQCNDRHLLPDEVDYEASAKAMEETLHRYPRNVVALSMKENTTLLLVAAAFEKASREQIAKVCLQALEEMQQIGYLYSKRN
jgi:hypothetical protein